MNNNNLFYESLTELMTNHNLNSAQLARATGCPTNTISDWLNKSSLPKIKNLLLLSDYFDCSFDYILGLTDIKTYTRNITPVSFKVRLNLILENKKITKYRVAKDCNFNENRFDNWIKNENIPQTENIIVLAKYFDCSVEYLLGISDVL